jgi:LacI family transcriptional regulator
MATIKDVAQAAGVSVATVSRVYNDSELVREQTALRVQEAAIRLGYVPHGGARSLSTSRTHTLGVILPDLYGEFFSEVIRGVDQTAQRNGFHLLISSSHEGRPAVEAALRSMRGRVDGLIVMWPEMDADTAVRNLPAGFPMVLVSAPVGPGAFDVITIANYDGAHAMVQHLLGLGHRRIAIIKGAEGNYDAAERLRGYRAALAESGVAPCPALEAAGDFSESSGFRATGELLAGTPVPTAIFAANDSMAIGALSALREAKRRVPDDVAVAGFDDIPLARFLDPPLSSVHVDISALGERATLRLLEAIREKAAHAHRTETFPTTLVLRRSCGAAAPSTRPTAPAAGPAMIHPSPLRGAS